MPSRNNSVSYANYTVDTTMSVPHRTAHFLMWLRNKAPKRYVSPQDITKIVNLLPRRPMEDSDEVKKQMGRCSRVDEILRKEHSQPGDPVGMVRNPLEGIRASSDPDDYVRYCVDKRARRLSSSVRNLNDTTSIVNTRDVSDPRLKKNLSALHKIGKEFEGDNLTKKIPLLPAKRDDEEEDR